MKLNHFQSNFRILGSAPILCQTRVARDADTKFDGVDLDLDGRLGAQASEYKGTSTEPVFTVPMIKVKQHAQHTGKEVITQDDFPRQEVASGGVYFNDASLSFRKSLNSLVERVAPFATVDERAQAKWAIDAANDQLYFFLETKPTKPDGRKSFDFRCEHTILGEAAILDSPAQDRHRNPVDLDGNGAWNRVNLGQSKHSKEPFLSVSFNKMLQIGEEQGKEVLLDSELSGLKLSQKRTDWFKSPSGDPVAEFLPQIAPLASEEQTAKARWGVDLKRKKLFFFTEDAPPPEQMPTLGEKFSEAVVGPVAKKAREVTSGLLRSADNEEPGLLRRILATSQGWVEALRQRVGF